MNPSGGWRIGIRIQPVRLSTEQPQAMARPAAGSKKSGAAQSTATETNARHGQQRRRCDKDLLEDPSTIDAFHPRLGQANSCARAHIIYIGRQAIGASIAVSQSDGRFLI